MLGTTFFDEADSSAVLDVRIDVNKNTNTNTNNSNNAQYYQNSCELRQSNDTSFVSACGNFHVASWVDNRENNNTNTNNTVKALITDRSQGGYRPPKLVRVSTSAPGFALGSFLITQLPKSTANSNNNNNNSRHELEFAVILCSGATSTPRLFFTRLIATLDENPTITVQKMKQSVSSPIAPANDQQQAMIANANERENASVSAFGLCSSSSGTLSVAVAMTNGLVFVLQLAQQTGEEMEQMIFSVDAVRRKAIEDAERAQESQRRQQRNNTMMSDQENQQQEQRNDNSSSSSALGKLFGWISGGNNSTTNQHQDPNDENDFDAFNQDLQRRLDNIPTNFVTSLSFCPQTKNLFLCCSEGILLFFNIESSSFPEPVPLPSHLKLWQVLACDKTCGQFMLPSTAEQTPMQNNNNNDDNTGDDQRQSSSPSTVYVVCDDVSTAGVAPVRYLMNIDTESFLIQNNWSAPSSSSHSRCLRVEPPRLGHNDEVLDICYAVWEIPENRVSVLWSPTFGVAYVNTQILAFFLDDTTAESCSSFNVVVPSSKVISIRENNSATPRMTGLETTIASLAVAARPAVDNRNTVLFPDSGRCLLTNSVGGSDLINITDNLPKAIQMGIRILSNTQMWREFDGLLGKMLSDPDSSSNLGWFNQFADIVAITEDVNNSEENDENNSSSISDSDMNDAISFLMNPCNLVACHAASPVRTRRWIADRLSQSLFVAATGLVLARIAWTCYRRDDSANNNNSNFSSSDLLDKKLAAASMMFASGHHVASSLGPQCTVLIDSRNRDKDDCDFVIVGKCLSTLMRGSARHFASSLMTMMNNNNDDDSAAAFGSSASTSSAASQYLSSAATQKTIIHVAGRLLKATQESGRSKPLSMWIAFWKKKFPIVSHYDAVLIASHHTHDSNPGVASMLFAQALQDTCSALASLTTTSSEQQQQHEDDDVNSDDNNEDAAAPTAAGSGMFAPAEEEDNNASRTTITILSRFLFDLLQGTAASLPSLEEISRFLSASPSFALFEACRLYRSSMLLLFLNGGGSATFNCQPDLVESLLCDVKQVLNQALVSRAGQLERLLSYLLVESSLFLTSVEIHRRRFFVALQHLSTVCRNDPSRSTAVTELVGVIVQNVLDDREAQHQLVKAGINDEPLLRAVNEALIESIMQPTPSIGVSREERDLARVQHTVFFVEFLAARGALGSAARVAHDVASRMRSFQRCNVTTLRSAANLIALSLAICRSIPEVEPPNIVAGFGTGSSRSSGGGSRAGEMMTGMGGNDLDFQQSFANGGGAGMVTGRTMVFTPSGVARKPLCRRHVPELQRRLLWILCEAKLASRAPVDRPSWSDDLDGALNGEFDAEPLISTVRELLHLRMWDDALRLCDAYPDQLHAGSVFQVRLHDMLSSDLWSKTTSMEEKMTIEYEQPLPSSSSSSSSALSNSYQVSLRDIDSPARRANHNNDDEEEEDCTTTKERKLFLTEQWSNVINDITSHPRRKELLRSASEQLLAHPNGDLVPRFVYDALGDEDPATLLELSLNCTRVSTRITDLAFDIVINYFEKKKYAHLPHVVLPVTLLERLVLGARRLQQSPQLSSSVPQYVLQKAPKIDQLVTNHFRQ